MFKKILSYPLTVIFYIVYGLILIVFQPIQWIAFNLFGYTAHKKVVDVISFLLLYSLLILGTRIKFINKHKIPSNTPLIITSNHQSLHDISGLGWFFRKYHPKFVAKIELGKGIPTISYNLTHGGSVLIDRKNPKQALPALKKFGSYLEKNKYAAIIFPEGTRSKTGVPKRFSANGLKMMAKFSPSSVVVPVTINGSWEILKNGNFPLELGVKLSLEAHEPITSNSLPFDDLLEKTEKAVINSVHLPQKKE